MSVCGSTAGTAGFHRTNVQTKGVSVAAEPVSVVTCSHPLFFGMCVTSAGSAASPSKDSCPSPTCRRNSKCTTLGLIGSATGSEPVKGAPMCVCVCVWSRLSCQTPQL